MGTDICKLCWWDGSKCNAEIERDETGNIIKCSQYDERDYADYCKKCPELPFYPNCDDNVPCPFALRKSEECEE